MTTSPESGKAVLRPTIKHLADPVHCLALGFGSGLAPFAPGTFGSLVGLGVALAVAPLGFAWNLGATILAIVAGIWPSQTSRCSASANSWSRLAESAAVSTKPSTFTGQKRRLPVISLRKPDSAFVDPTMTHCLGWLSTLTP